MDSDDTASGALRDTANPAPRDATRILPFVEAGGLDDRAGRVEVPADPRDLPGDFHHRRAVEVRFGDTDAMGHVNNAVFLSYLEMARAGYYQRVTGGLFGIGATSGERSFILADVRLTFRSPAWFAEILTLETRVTRIGRWRVQCHPVRLRDLKQPRTIWRRRLCLHTLQLRPGGQPRR